MFAPDMPQNKNKNAGEFRPSTWLSCLFAWCRQRPSPLPVCAEAISTFSLKAPPSQLHPYCWGRPSPTISVSQRPQGTPRCLHWCSGDSKAWCPPTDSSTTIHTILFPFASPLYNRHLRPARHAWPSIHTSFCATGAVLPICLLVVTVALHFL